VELMKNLGIDFELNCMGPLADTIIAERLAAGISSVFFLWEPHPLHKQYVLNRIQLPTYAQAKFDQGLSDYPTDILVKTASATLPKLAPKVWQMLQRFMIDRCELLAPAPERQARKRR
jgi:ABC-type proline/glycine betaine transport system substrate-binding protein